MSMDNLTFNYHMPTKIVFESGAAARLGTLDPIAGKRCLMLKFRSFHRDDIVRNIKDSASLLIVSDKYEENPTCRLIADIAQTLENEGIDTVIAIGGGSAIDAGKGALALLHQKTGRALRLVAVPTTSGSGSEVTPYALIADNETGDKKDISKSGLAVFPDIALCDPELTVSMPGRVTANTGIDALSHALEGYFTDACTGMMEALAVDGIERVRRYLPDALKKPGDIGARSQMMMGALEGGLVLTCCGTVLVHAMGYAVSKEMKMPHGLANAVFLAAFVERFAGRGSERAKRVLDIFDGGFRRFVDDSLNGANLVKMPGKLKDECVKLGMAKLRTLGDPSTCLPNSIIPLGEEDVHFIVEASCAG